MKHTRMGKTLRTFSLAVAGVCALATGLLFASCDNFGGDVASFDPALFFVAGGTQDAAGGTNVGQSGGQAVGAFAAQSLGSLSANVSIPNMPALPTATTTPGAIQASDGAANASALDISNSAMPDIADATGTGYKFTATLAQAGAGGATYTAEGTYAAGVCSFEFADARSSAEQNYTLTVSLYYSDALVASGEKAVTVAAGAADFTADVSLAPNTASGASNGTLALPIKFSDTSVTSVGVNLIDSGGTDVAATYVEGGSSVALTSGAGTIASVTGGLPPGTYTLLMTFKKGSAQVGARTETLNVYPTLATKVWWTNSSAGLVSELVITSYDQTEFWVKGEGGVFYSDVYTAYTGAGLDTNVGSFAAPLKTIQEAVDRINDAGDTTTQYTVYIDGKVTGDPDSNDSSLAYINKARKILFKGWTGPDTDIIDVNKNWESSPLYPTRAFYIYAAATITAQNLGITNASSGTSSDGGAIGFNAAANGAVVTLENCKISGCGAQNGGAISVYNGTLNLKQCSVYHNNATRDGGGIYVNGQAASTTILVTIEDSQIYDNTATATSYGDGGGIYVKTNARVNFKSGVIGSDDTTKGNKCKNGGGVDVASGGIFEMSGSARIVGNSASNNGGGIYVAGGQAIFSSGTIGSDDPSKGNTAKNGGGVWVSSSGKFSMSGSSRVSGNSATTNGGGIYSEGELLMGGSSQVCGNTANYGGGVYISAGCFCMSGSAIVGAAPTGLTEAAQADDAKHSNKATNNGGGILTYTPSRLKLGYVNEITPDPTFSGGIYYNYANNGGGIYASGTASTATLEIERGSVCYNGAANDGGGILGYGLSGDSILKITGGQISYNSAKDGGGLCANRVYVGGGTIAGNTASDYGGGVYAGSDFYLYGTGVIGDPNKAEIAAESDCSNKAKAGGGVFAHHAYIGYSDASTPAACTGGIYRNYATAVKGSETYFYSGGGICVVGMAANWLFKMQSGTVAYNAGDSSDGYGGGLFIYGSGMIDSSIAYPQVTGGSFVGNGAKYGGALCCYSNTFAVGGSVHMPSATGEKGDNDIYINNDLCRLHLASPFDAATPTPVLTATPSAYSPGKNIFDTSIGSECSKIGVASNDDSIPWAVGNDGKLVKDCAIVYVASTSATPNPGDDDFGDGSEQHPYATIRKAASMFSDKTAAPGGTEYNPLFKNKVYVLSDITFGAGAGATGDCNFEVVGCAGGVEGSPVTMAFNTSGTGFYVPSGQIVKFTGINITRTLTSDAVYAAVLAEGGRFYMEDCSITGIRTKDCSAIATDGSTGAGKVYLKNVSIKNNVVNIPNTSGGSVWGPAVSVKSGYLYVSGKVEICDNTMKVEDAAGNTAYKEMNVWIGENTGTPVFHPIVVVGALDADSKIGVTSYDISDTVFTDNYKNAGNAASPDTYFTSDDGFTVGWNSASKEAQLKVPSSLYVSATGSDLTGNGTSARPYATITKAVEKTAWFNDATKNYTINVAAGSYLSQAIVIDSSGTLGTAPVAASITITGNSKTTSVLSGNGGDSIINIFDNAVPLTIKKLRFTNGIAGTFGGAIDVEYSTPGTTSAEILIEDCLFDTCSSSGSSSGGGGAINICSGATVKVKDTTFTGNSAVNGGAIYNSGTCYVYGSTVIGNASAAGTDAAESATSKHSNSASANGGAIYNAGKLYLGYSSYTSPSVCTPEAFTGGIYYNYANRGGGIYNNTSAEVVIASGTYKRNGVAADSGGGAIFNAGSLTMNDGLIDSNAGGLGAGVYVTEVGSFTMNDGTISGNTADTSVGGGGGVLAAGAFTMNGGTISGNSGHFGGGVWIYSGTGTITGGEISGNKAEVGAGLCVYTSSVASGSAIVEASMTNGTISANIGTLYGGTESCGGGVYVHENCKFHISDGTIKQNTATNGGAVYANFNSAESTYGEFRISGGAMIPAGNSSGATGAGKNDVRCVPPIVIGGDLTATAPVATVTPGAYNTSQKILYAESATLLEDNHDKFDVTPNGTETWSIDENGYLSQSAAGAGSVTIYTPEGQFNLSVNKTTITTSASATTVTVTAKNSSGTDISTSADFSDWTIDCYYGTSVTPVKTQSGRQFTFATNYPKGAYRLTVTVKYKGAEYSDSFVITKTVD